MKITNETTKNNIEVLKNKTIKDIKLFEGESLQIETECGETFIICIEYGYESVIEFAVFGKHNVETYPTQFCNFEKLEFGWITEERKKELEEEDRQKEFENQKRNLNGLVNRLGFEKVRELLNKLEKTYES